MDRAARIQSPSWPAPSRSVSCSPARPSPYAPAGWLPPAVARPDHSPAAQSLLLFSPLAGSIGVRAYPYTTCVSGVFRRSGLRARRGVVHAGAAAPARAAAPPTSDCAHAQATLCAAENGSDLREPRGARPDLNMAWQPPPPQRAEPPSAEPRGVSARPLTLRACPAPTVRTLTTSCDTPARNETCEGLGGLAPCVACSACRGGFMWARLRKRSEVACSGH
jgi:hypothetical protein